MPSGSECRDKKFCWSLGQQKEAHEMYFTVFLEEDYLYNFTLLFSSWDWKLCYDMSPVINKVLNKGQMSTVFLSYNPNRTCEAYKNKDSPFKKECWWSRIFERIPEQRMHLAEDCRRSHSRGGYLASYVSSLFES